MEDALKAIISLILLCALLLSFSACNKKQDGDSENDNNNPATDTPTGPVTIIVPEYKDYGRGTVNFSDIVYSRPSVLEISAKFDAVASDVAANELNLSTLIDNIKDIESDYNKTITMYSLAEIYSCKDSSVDFWKKEFEHLSTNYPTFSQSVEGLLVACAKSPHRESFETEYFGYSLEEYVDGGIYTDEVVELMSEEARLEAEYSNLSMDTVEIVYNEDWKGTATEVLAMAREKYGADSQEYSRIFLAVTTKYNSALIKLEVPIFVNLLKVRRLIADELNYDSYATLAYDRMGYDYSLRDMVELIKDVGRYVTPVSSVLSDYMKPNTTARPDRVEIINSLYKVYRDLDPELFSTYCYMLQHGLYDVAPLSESRFRGSFTTYLPTNESPYIFVSTEGYLDDYLTLAHEFGHFFDGYVNWGDDASLDVSEISSQSLELLTLAGLRSKLKADEYAYLEARAMDSAMNSVLLNQSFIAAFEHMAYDIDYDDITEARLNSALANAAECVYGTDIGYTPYLYEVIIPHTVLYPFYVESYVTSGIVSLELFFMESHLTGSAGSGMALYKQIVKRESSDQTFFEIIDNAGLTSPFADGHVKKIANNIYYQRMGKYYYTTSGDNIGAA